jgi:hypothetical protein
MTDMANWCMLHCQARAVAHAVFGLYFRTMTRALLCVHPVTFLSVMVIILVTHEANMLAAVFG